MQVKVESCGLGPALRPRHAIYFMTVWHVLLTDNVQRALVMELASCELSMDSV
jgi:hypothetical protein